MSFGIALSGGGAKGAAHIGVLKALEENNLIPSSISGTSIGSIVGGLYALGYSPTQLENILKNFSQNYFIYLDPCYKNYAVSIFQLLSRSTITMSGLILGNKLENYLKKLTKNKSILDSKIPFIAPCVDLITSKTIYFTSIKNNLPESQNEIWDNNAKLYEVMRASASLPAIFYPKKIKNRLLIDGGISDNIPINALFSTVEKNILAVDLSQDYEKPQNSGILELTMHSFEIMQQNTKKNLTGKEKYLLTLKFPTNIGLMDLKNMYRLINIGYNATIDVMPQLKLIFSN